MSIPWRHFHKSKVYTKIYANFYSPLQRIYYRKRGHENVDVLFASYPRSGRTWVRNFLGIYFSKIYGLKPTIFHHRRKSELVPTIRFTNNPRNIGLHKNKRAIYLFRDPRDAVVSFYYHNKNIGGRFKGTLAHYIRSDVGVTRLVNDWNDMSKLHEYPSDILYLFYEKMRLNPKREFTRILKFLEIPVKNKFLADALEESSFKTMRKEELSHKVERDKNKLFTRKGKIKGFVDDLTREDIEFINNRLKYNLDPSIFALFKKNGISILDIPKK